jgi:hypothetical protein
MNIMVELVRKECEDILKIHTNKLEEGFKNEH